MTKTGRNAPCPCNSGKKYKHCCIAKEVAYQAPATEEVDARLRAMDWLLKNYATAMNDAIARIFFQGSGSGLSELIEELSENEKYGLFYSMYEWLIAEGELDIEELPVRVSDLLLGPDGPLLSAKASRHIEDLSVSTISLYKVIEVSMGEGILVSDVLRTDKTPIFVNDKDASIFLSPLDIAGLRVIRREADYILGASILPFKPYIVQQFADATPEEVRFEIDKEVFLNIADELISVSIISVWLKVTTMLLPKLTSRLH